EAVGKATVDGLFVRPEPDAFGRAQNISIDHGASENTPRGVFVLVEMQWSDVGAWDAVWKLSAKDPTGNATSGNVIAVDTRDSLLRSDGQAIIAAIGLDKLAVIAVRDAVFVAPMERVAEVKELVEALKRDERECVLIPPKVARPWGSYEAIADGPRFQAKHIIVDPGETLSLQMHFH